MNQISVSKSERICLFGEHHDYLGLPVIAVGIFRRVSITGEKRQYKKINIYMPHINESDSFNINFP